MVIYLKTEVCVHTTRYYGQRVRNCKTLVKFIVFFITGDTIKIKISENTPPLSVTHVDDFGNYFPNVDLSPPAC